MESVLCSSACLKELEELYTEAFPANERMPFSQMLSLSKDDRYALRALKDAYAALCVSLEGVAPEEVRVEKDGDMLRAHARMAGAAMDVHSPIRPVPRKAWKGYAALNGTLLNETYGLPSPIEANA